MVSNKFIEECKNGAYNNRLGSIYVENTENPITESDNLKKISIDSGCYINGSIIGSVYIKKLTGEFIAVPNDVDLIDKQVNAKVGIKYDDGTTEYVEMGKYIVERPTNKETADQCQIVAYDKLINNIEEKYVCGIDYSQGEKKVSDLYVDVCNQLGLTPKTTIFLNCDIPIEDNPFTNGEKNRIVLETIGKVACSYIVVDGDDIDLEWLSSNENPDYTFYETDYSTLEGGKIKLGPINSVVIKNSQVDDENVTMKNEESIALNGENSITISEDYILYNSELRQQAISKIYARLNGLEYYDCKLVSYYGKPFLKIGNKIRVYISDSNYFDTYILSHLFTYDGSYESTIQSPVLTQQEVKTKQDIGLREALKNTEIIVDKQGQIIKQITSSIEVIDDMYTKEQVNELIQTAETGLTNTFSTSGGNNVFRNTSLAFLDNSQDKKSDYEFWSGVLQKGTEENSETGTCILLQNGTCSQSQVVLNGDYTISFKYKKIINLSNAKVYINNTAYDLENTTSEKEFILTLNITTKNIEVKFECDTNDGYAIYDLMVNSGTTKAVYSQNQNETITSTVNISKGIEVTNSNINTKTRIDADGQRTINTVTGEVVNRNTEQGTETNEILVKNKAQIVGMVVSNTRKQVWLSSIVGGGN